MTLIIKKLVIRGIVTNDESALNESANFSGESPLNIEELKKEITRDCVEKVTRVVKKNSRR